MRFYQPEILWLLAIIPFLWLLFIYSNYKKQQGLKLFLNLNSQNNVLKKNSTIKNNLKQFLVLFSIALLIIAIARPQYDKKTEIIQKKSLDIIIAIDVSQSMNAQDIKPNRLTRSKHEIIKLLNKLKGDRVGLVAFAGDAFLQCPLTSDYTTLKIFIDILSSDLIQDQGTNIGKAIKTSLEAWRKSKNQNKIMLLLSDGEEQTQSLSSAISEAKKNDLKIYVIGIGSEQGVPIPKKKNGQLSYIKDKNGNIVSTRLHRKLLESIANQTNGKYFDATPEYFHLDAIFNEIESIEKNKSTKEKIVLYQERFQIPLLLAFLLLFIERLISKNKKKDF